MPNVKSPKNRKKISNMSERDEKEMLELKIELLIAYLESLKGCNYHEMKSKKANSQFMKTAKLLEKFLTHENRQKYQQKAQKVFSDGKTVEKKQFKSMEGI